MTEQPIWSSASVRSRVALLLEQRHLSADVVRGERVDDATWFEVRLVRAPGHRLETRLLIEDGATCPDVLRRIERAVVIAAGDLDPDGPWPSVSV